MTKEKPNADLQAGSKVKCYTALSEEYHRGVVKEIDHDSETAEVLYLEGEHTGDVVELDFDDIRPLKQKVWLCLIGNHYGVSKNQEKALANAARYFDADDKKEQVTVWMAEVDQNNWRVDMTGVRSTFIENETEFEVKAGRLEKIGNIAEELDDLSRAAMNDYEPEWDYMEEVRR